MARLFLTYGKQEVEMPRGESFVGRAIDCHLRLNDAAVSRKHLRVITTSTGAYVENLSKTNGTRLNGKNLSESHLLRHGDSIDVGHRVLIAKLEVGAEPEDSGPVTMRGPLEVGPGLLVSEDLVEEEEPEEKTRPGGLPGVFDGTIAPSGRDCPKCRARVSRLEASCPSCEYWWPPGGPSSFTQEIELPIALRQRKDRLLVAIPVVYASELLVLDANARDLGQGGMFIASEILDPVGTTCELTVLPDGYGALRFVAKVCHVSTIAVGTRPPGFGVEFTEASEEAQRWLDELTAKTTEP